MCLNLTDPESIKTFYPLSTEILVILKVKSTRISPCIDSVHINNFVFFIEMQIKSINSKIMIFLKKPQEHLSKFDKIKFC